MLVATDGSPSARAAVDAAAGFPWPRGTRLHGVVARRATATRVTGAPIRTALDIQTARTATNVKRALARRDRDVDVVVVDRPPVAAILQEARRLKAGAIVMGWRGHGPFRRLMMGSVSRDVLREAKCPVLVVRRRPRELRAFVLGLDGSSNARRAARFLATLLPPRGGRVTVIRIEEPMSMPPTAGRLPAGVRAVLRREVAEINAGRLRRAKRDVDAVAATLARRGWSVRTIVRFGAPLDGLLDAVAASGAHAMVVGARGTGGMKRLLLGSVADGALNRSPVPVLVVR